MSSIDMANEKEERVSRREHSAWQSAANLVRTNDALVVQARTTSFESTCADDDLPSMTASIQRKVHRKLVKTTMDASTDLVLEREYRYVLPLVPRSFDDDDNHAVFCNAEKGVGEHAEMIVWKTHRFRKQTKQMKHSMNQMVNIAKMTIRITHQSS